MKKVLITLFIMTIVCLSLFAVKSENENLNLDVTPVEFDTSTTITVRSLDNTDVNLFVLDTRGVIVKVIYQGSVRAGETVFTWDGSDYKGSRLPNGKYTVELAPVSKYTSLKKIIILK